ncbi:uncharacterized protein [Apostichopus japonicus]|uniref:uncharacterized protein n=1 Tax=Stichopus japonicus TaxID=307972 RepID=UPI003AB4653A
MSATPSESELSSERFTTTTDPVVCRCRSTCSRKRGRGACPCKVDEKSCGVSCRCGSNRKPCRNRYESDDSSEEEEMEQSPTTNQDEEPSENRDEVILTFLQDLDRSSLEEIAAQLLRRNPGAYQDIITRQANDDVSASLQVEEAPSWCVCGNCHDMNSAIEQRCCGNRNICLATQGIFSEICLNGNILDVAMRANEDTFADTPDRSNANFRYYAYRQYIYWQHGRLGAHRERYPSADGRYKGFQLGDAILVD